MIGNFSANIKLRFSSEHWRKSWKIIIERTFALLGGLELCFSVACHFYLGESIPKFPIWFGILVIVALFICAIILTSPLSNVSHKIDGHDLRVTVKLGNVLNDKGDIVLSCNTAFDTCESGHLSSDCLRAQYQKRFYPGNLQSLDNAIESALRDEKFETVKPVFNGAKTKRYPVGTIAEITPNKNSRTYFVAFSEMSSKGRKSTTIKNFLFGLNCLWERVNNSIGNKRIKMPVLCSGESNLRKSREDIIKYIVFSYVNYARAYKISRSLTIFILPDDLSDSNLDMYSLDKFVELICAGDLMSISEFSDDADSTADEKSGTMKEL